MPELTDTEKNHTRKIIKAVVSSHVEKWWREGKINHAHLPTDTNTLIEELIHAVTTSPAPCPPASRPLLADLPAVPINELAGSAGELQVRLLTGAGLPPRPFSLVIGNDRFKVTEENRGTLSLGLLLGLGARDHLGR